MFLKPSIGTVLVQRFRCVWMGDENGEGVITEAFFLSVRVCVFVSEAQDAPADSTVVGHCGFVCMSWVCIRA